jgi:4'-phosphopantetheinyl transferase
MGTFKTGELSMDSVHLWWEDIDGQLERISDFWSILPRDERMRAERFRRQNHRERFIVQKGRLREILSGYLDVLPEKIRFCSAPGGKPGLEGGGRPILFNLSHSGGRALCAVSGGREVGVDVEAVRPKPKAAALVNRFFSSVEKAAFNKLDSTEKLAAFFAGWTRKEAYVKALGKGLRFPLDRFHVSLKPGDQNALLGVEGAPDEVKRWSLRDINLGPDFRAALAVETTGECSFKDLSIRFKCCNL